MATAMMPLGTLLTQWGVNTIAGQFEPCAHYYDAMDSVIFLQEDVSYRADRVDQFLTLLWHPYEDRAIGVKLKGWRHLFGRLQVIAETLKISLADEDFVPLTAGLEIALTAGAGAEIVADAERERVQEKYAQARVVVGTTRMHTHLEMAA